MESILTNVFVVHIGMYRIAIIDFFLILLFIPYIAVSQIASHEHML